MLSLLKHSSIFPRLINVSVRTQRTSQCRYMAYFRVAPRRAEKARIRDKIPDGFELVYKSPLINYVHGAQSTAIVGGALLVGMGIYLIINPEITLSRNSHGIRTPTEFFVGILSLTVITTVLQVFALRCPKRIYASGNEYIAIYNGFWGPLFPKRFNFSAGECKKLPHSKVSMWNGARFSVRGKTVIMLDHHFRNNSDFNAMLSKE